MQTFQLDANNKNNSFLPQQALSVPNPCQLLLTVCIDIPDYLRHSVLIDDECIGAWFSLSKSAVCTAHRWI